MAVGSFLFLQEQIKDIIIKTALNQLDSSQRCTHICQHTHTVRIHPPDSTLRRRYDDAPRPPPTHADDDDRRSSQSEGHNGPSSFI